MNSDVLLAFGGLTLLAIVGVLYGLYDERKSKRKDAAIRKEQ